MTLTISLKERSKEMQARIWDVANEICFGEEDYEILAQLLLDYGYDISRMCRNKNAYKLYAKNAIADITEPHRIDWQGKPRIEPKRPQ